MRKLRLNVEEIEVAGFETVQAATDGAGTVEGAEFFLTRITFCDQDTCGVTCQDATCIC
jgi:hypothetical protein